MAKNLFLELGERLAKSGQAEFIFLVGDNFDAKSIAALKIIALREKDRLQGKGITVDESRAQLRAAPSKPQIITVVILPDAQEDCVLVLRAARSTTVQCPSRQNRVSPEAINFVLMKPPC